MQPAALWQSSAASSLHPRGPVCRKCILHVSAHPGLHLAAMCPLSTEGRKQDGRAVVVAETEAGQTSTALPSLNLPRQGCSHPKVPVFLSSHVRHEWPFNGLLLNSRAAAALGLYPDGSKQRQH